MTRCHCHGGASSDTGFGIHGLICEFGMTSDSAGLGNGFEVTDSGSHLETEGGLVLEVFWGTPTGSSSQKDEKSSPSGTKNIV